MWRSAAPDVDIVCHVRVEWIFRELSAAIMRCIPKEKNREEEITCSVLHFEKIRAVHPSVFPVESVRRIARSTLRSARSWKMPQQNLRMWSIKLWKQESSYWNCGKNIVRSVLACAPVLQRWQQPSWLCIQRST